MTHRLSFPGLGIGEFDVNTVAFTLFGRDIAWYGVIVTLGIIAAFSYAMYRSKHERIKSDDVLDLAIFVIISGVIGARAFYVLTTLDQYHSFYDVIAIWKGGLAIYGGIIAGALAGFFVAKVKKISVFKLFDMMAPGVMLGQMIGRWGNFVNAEAHGTETDWFCRMGIYEPSLGKTVFYHPTFLYESLWNAIGFVIINLFYKKKKYDGQIFFMYMTWYGFGRFFIEGLRTDSLYVPGTGIRISQAIGIVSFAVGVLCLILFSYKAKKNNENAVPETAEGASLNADETPEKTAEAVKTEDAEETETSDETEEAEETEKTDKEGAEENGENN